MLPGADGATPDRFRGSRCESESQLGDASQCPTPALQGARHDRVRSYSSGAGLVVHVPAAVAPADVEYGPGFPNRDPVRLAVRAEGREGCLPAIRAMKLFHCFLP